MITAIAVSLVGSVFAASIIPVNTSINYVAAGGGGTVSLNTSLIAYWKMDEASGNATDSEPTGTAQTLTASNGPGSTTGVVGTARTFVAASSRSFLTADNADLSVGSGVSFSISAWVYLDTTGADRYIVAKSSSGVQEFALFYSTSQNKFSFKTGSDQVDASSFGAPSTGTWYFVVGVHDSGAGQNHISVNAGAQNSVAASDPSDSTQSFRVGTWGGSGGYWDGRLDEIGFWKKALNTAEITALYNSGSGVTCCAFP